MASGKKPKTDKETQAAVKSAKRKVDTLLKVVREPKTVKIGNVDLELQRPSKEARLNYEKVRYEFALKNPDGKKEVSMAEVMEMQDEMAVMAVMGCLPYLDREEAEDLLIVAGGLTCELVEKCTEFYGVDKRAIDAYEKGDLDLSFLSQGQQDEA